MAYQKLKEFDGVCLSCGYKGGFKTRGSCPKCHSSNVKSSQKRIKLPTNWEKEAQRLRKELARFCKAHLNHKKMERIHHEFFQLLKLEVGRDKYSELLKKAQRNAAEVEKRKKPKQKKGESK